MHALAADEGKSTKWLNMLGICVRKEGSKFRYVFMQAWPMLVECFPFGNDKGIGWKMDASVYRSSAT
jgi:hypothetical protein